MSTLKVRGMFAQKESVVLYLEDGTTRTLTVNDDVDMKRLLTEMTPLLARGEVVEVDLYRMEVIRQIEEKGNGLVRFFRRVKRAVLGEPAPKPADPVVVTEPVIERPISHPSELMEGETMVAKVGDVELEGVENLTPHLEHIAKTGKVEGFARFVERAGRVAAERRHSVDELLEFMRSCDLPITDDGSILGYKKLRVLYEEKEVFVDNHTKKVRQSIGSRVEMPADLVDPDRRKECSNGLHIARYDYLKGFNGDVIMLVKIAPEDVIAVPEHDKSKMRVRAYEILDRLPDNARITLDQGRPMSGNPEALKMVARAIAGDYPPARFVTHIGGHFGSEITYSGIDAPAPVHKPVKVEPATLVAVDGVRQRQEEIDTKAVAEKARLVQAAQSGDMSVAVSVPKSTPAPKPAPKKVKAVKTEEVKKPTNAPKPPSNAFPADENGLSDDYRLALKKARDGVALRQVERETGVSARTVKRLTDRYGK